MDHKEKLAIAAMDHGGALSLAMTALIYLETPDASNDDLQVAANLLNRAAKLADHAALYRRIGETEEIE